MYKRTFGVLLGALLVLSFGVLGCSTTQLLARQAPASVTPTRTPRPTWTPVPGSVRIATPTLDAHAVSGGHTAHGCASDAAAVRPRRRCPHLCAATARRWAGRTDGRDHHRHGDADASPQLADADLAAVCNGYPTDPHTDARPSTADPFADQHAIAAGGGHYERTSERAARSQRGLPGRHATGS